MARQLLLPSGTKASLSGLKKRDLAYCAAAVAHLYLLTTQSNDRLNGYWLNLGQQDWMRLTSTRRYRLVQQILVERDILEINPRYSSGQSTGVPFTKSFRLTRQYRIPEFEVMHVASTSKKEFTKRPSDGDGLGQWMFEQLPKFELSTSVEIPDQYARLKLAHIWNQNFYAVRDRFGRFHTNFVSLNRCLRNQISLDSQPMTSLDVANCQPYLLNFLEPRITGITYLEATQQGYFYELLLEECLAQGLRAKYTRKRRATDSGWQTSDQSQVVLDWDGNILPTRSMIKTAVYRIFFATIEQSRALPEFEVFQDLFPQTAYGITELKKQYGYEALAHALQRKESELVSTVIRSHIKRDPQSPLFTVHDGIYCQNKAAQAITKDLQTAFTIGENRPQIHQEQTTPKPKSHPKPESHSKTNPNSKTNPHPKTKGDYTFTPDLGQIADNRPLRFCVGCGELLPRSKRRDAIVCSSRCQKRKDRRRD